MCVSMNSADAISCRTVSRTDRRPNRIRASSSTNDKVFANEAELHSLYQTSDFEGALKQLRGDAKLGIVTRSEKGHVVASKDGVVAVPAFPIPKLVDHYRRRRRVRRRLPVRPRPQRRP